MKDVRPGRLKGAADAISESDVEESGLPSHALLWLA
jgi:hypothetical protein